MSDHPGFLFVFLFISNSRGVEWSPASTCLLRVPFGIRVMAFCSWNGSEKYKDHFEVGNILIYTWLHQNICPINNHDVTINTK